MVSLESLHARRAVLIYNPVARGLARRHDSLQRTIGALARQDIKAELVPTTGPGSASLQVRKQIDAGCDLVLVAGGDGTVNEVANGMLHTDVPLGILPGGTANVLAREMGLSMHADRAASRLRTMKVRNVAIGRMRSSDSGPRSFLCMAGAGLDADVVSRLNLDLKAAAGKLAYYLSGFAQVLRYLPEFEVIVDGTSHAASFALISRVRNYGGDLEIARGASLLRDDFEVVLFRGTLAVQYVPYLLAVALKQVHRMSGCKIFRASSVTCKSAAGTPVLVQVDGELAGSLPFTAEAVPNALKLLVPAEYEKREVSRAALRVCA
ncbi:MAG: diacylglycerol/lipid kinase family protein [Bryobacteraceae bacterium]